MPLKLFPQYEYLNVLNMNLRIIDTFVSQIKRKHYGRFPS